MNNAEAAGATETVDHEIAERVAKALGTRGVDKKSLAQQVGLSYTTLRRSLEQHRGDNRSFTFRELGKIAEVLEVKPSTLIPDSLADRNAA